MPLSQFSRGGSNRGRRVCVIGGGLGGLTAALAFARSGAVVNLHEQAAALTETGAGIQITPNGARPLAALGLDDALADASISAQAVEPTDALSGRRISRFDLNALKGPPYRFFHRADLINVLATACHEAGVKVHLSSHVQVDDVDADLVVGADGLHSKTRNVLNAQSEPFFTGQVAWRTIVDMPDAAAVARIWMAPKCHVVTYPLKNGRLNIVAVQERQEWAAEGWAHTDDPANLRTAFANTAPELSDLLNRVTDVNLWGLFRHPVADVWVRDKICILGDAAHPTLPFLAQGANLAIEDASVLARCCDEVQGIPRALKTYQNLRRARVLRAIEAANANARNYHLSGVKRHVAHLGLKTLGVLAPSAFLSRMNWLYGYDATSQ